MPGGTPPGVVQDPAADPEDEAPAPMTPHAAPIVDEDGNLTYIGDDGRRYVIAPPPEQGG